MHACVYVYICTPCTRYIIPLFFSTASVGPPEANAKEEGGRPEVHWGQGMCVGGNIKAGEIIHVKVMGKRKQVLSCDPSELSHWLGAAGQNMAVA